MKDWNTFYSTLKDKHTYIIPNPPATDKQIINAEIKLKNKFPSDLRELLLTLNGDNYMLLSLEQMIDYNLMLRKQGCFMPLDCLLFFGSNGCGDYFGFPVTAEDGVRDDNVYMWEHETDSRIWKATDIEDAIKKYYSDEI